MVGEGSFSTIKTLINRNAKLYPDKIAMKEFETGKACTFKTLKDRANRMGNALRVMGLKKGDRVSEVFQTGSIYTMLPSSCTFQLIEIKKHVRLQTLMI